MKIPEKSSPDSDGSADCPIVAEGSQNHVTVTPAQNNDKQINIQPNPLAEKYEASKDISNIEIHDYKESRCCNMKYCFAIKNLIPCRPAPKESSYLPGHRAGLFSCLSLSWMSSLMYESRKGLKPESIWKLEPIDGSEVNARRLEKFWEDEQARAAKQGRDPNLVKAVSRSVRTRILVALVLAVLYSVLLFLLTSTVMRLTLQYVNSPEESAFDAWLILGLVVSVNLVRALLFNGMFIVSSHAAMRVVGGVQGMLFNKVLKLPAGGEELSGQISNIINNDMERIMEAIISVVFLPSFPITFIAAVAYSWYIVDYWCLVGYVAMFMFIPIVKYVTGLIGKYRVMVSKVSDDRVSLMTEILNNIRLIKMYSWEDSFSENIEKLRAQEVSKVRGVGLLQSFNMTLSPVMSTIALLCIFVAITLSGLPITSATAFTLASVLNCFQFSLGTIPFMLRSIAEAVVSFQRVQKILLHKEHKSHGFSVIQNSLAVNVQHASFEWGSWGEKGQKETESNGEAKKPSQAIVRVPDKEDSTAEDPLIDTPAVNVRGLRGLNLSIEKGKLIGLCGGVGSGKSSLLAALCGDMQAISGDVQINGRVALVTQQAWIYNSSLRNNLLMGMPFNHAKYNAMVDCCALATDIQLLPDGDSSEIGEKGINLSGGQKQRVSLGRAVYSDRDIYLLDDPLSAVDSRVARHIFLQCIKGALKGKTVLLVTHALHFLEQCDEVLLMKNGEMVERGTHAQLMEKDGAYAEFVSFDRTAQQENKETADQEQPSSGSSASNQVEGISSADRQTDKDETGKLISQETRESGTVNASVYRSYITASGGWCAVLLVLAGVLLFTMIRLFSVLWQQWWLDAGDGLVQERLNNLTRANESSSSISDEDLRGDISKNPDLYMYQGVQAALFFAIILTSLAKGYVTIYALTKGSKRLHNMMFQRVMRAPTSFFDVTPTGRIITRFSKDVDEIDYRIPTFFDLLIGSVFFMAASSFLVCFFFPYFAIVLVVVGVLFVMLGRMLDRGVKEFKRLESVLKSPVLQSASSCISGLQVIRAFGQEDMFSRRFYQLVDDHTVVLLVFRLSNRWFTFRMDLLALAIVSGITALCVLNKGTFSTAVAGLALTSVNGMCQFLPFLMRIKSEFESRMTSVERIVEYAFNIESEAPRHVPGIIPEDTVWPSKGAVTLKNICVRYRPNLPLVLKNISAVVKPGEKIGIVGRTGAGKSSLVSALLRLIELESGTIEVDGIDIRKLGLHTLRTAISVIPQDPVLFHGTLKYNLDPFDNYSEEEVLAAVQKSRLYAVVERLSDGLKTQVEAGGHNFSVGERQLICLARAILRNSKVLLLDEATASVDPETDQLIQTALQTSFADATLFTVAHRLNTVANYDRIMVLDAGEIKEFGTPSDLLSKEGSLFGQMLAAIGVTSVQQLQSLT